MTSTPAGANTIVRISRPLSTMTKPSSSRIPGPGWTPAKIVDPLHYVGTPGLASYLLATQAGNILFNTGMPESGPMIVESMRKLGFDPKDLKWAGTNGGLVLPGGLTLLLLPIATLAVLRRTPDPSVTFLTRDTSVGDQPMHIRPEQAQGHRHLTVIRGVRKGVANHLVTRLLEGGMTKLR